MFPIFAEAVYSVAPKPPSCTDSVEKQNNKNVPMCQGDSPGDCFYQGWSSAASTRVSLRVCPVGPFSVEGINHLLKSYFCLAPSQDLDTLRLRTNKGSKISYIIDNQRHTKQTTNNEVHKYFHHVFLFQENGHVKCHINLRLICLIIQQHYRKAEKSPRCCLWLKALTGVSLLYARISSTEFSSKLSREDKS